MKVLRGIEYRERFALLLFLVFLRLEVENKRKTKVLFPWQGSTWNPLQLVT